MYDYFETKLTFYRQGKEITSSVIKLMAVIISPNCWNAWGLKERPIWGGQMTAIVFWHCLFPHTSSLPGREAPYIRFFSPTRRRYLTVCQGRFIACWIHLYSFSPPRANVSNKEHELMKRHNSFCQLCHYDSIHSHARRQQYLWQQHSFANSRPLYSAPTLSQKKESLCHIQISSQRRTCELRSPVFYNF